MVQKISSKKSTQTKDTHKPTQNQSVHRETNGSGQEKRTREEMKNSDVQRIIEKLQNALMERNDPVKHCELYKDGGCSHVDGILCDFETCSMRLEYVGGPGKNFEDPLEAPENKILEKRV